MSDKISELTGATFKDAIATATTPVLVDFWAPWCGPCRMMSPTVDAIAADYQGRLKVGKLNVDENNGTAMCFNVRGIPTLLLFKGGKVVDQRVGAVGKGEIVKLVAPHLG